MDSSNTPYDHQKDCENGDFAILYVRLGDYLILEGLLMDMKEGF
jgi:hypothetical protein